MKKSENRTGIHFNKPAALVAFCIFIFVVFILAAAVSHITGLKPEMTLYGDEYVTLEQGSEFVEAGASAHLSLIGSIGPDLTIVRYGSLDVNTPGVYTLEYRTAFLGSVYSMYRTVTVADNTSPVITLKHDDAYRASWMTGYTEEGFTAYDAGDGDLTDKVTVTSRGDTLIYTVTDSSGNTTSVERKIVYSIGKPDLVLNGGNSYEMTIGDSYVEPGFTALDDMGNDMSMYVETESNLNPNVPGVYTINYYVTNSHGETIEQTRTVTVRSSSGEIGTSGPKVIYLTFDDGPGPYTAQLLDILAEYGVKATFFVTAQYPDYFDLIGRAYSEGHSIGVHSYTHDYYTIYASVDAFVNDFYEMQEIIREQTGSYTSIFRFPGGSSNTVSSFNPGIMTELADYMTSAGYSYFDWNVLSGDAGDTTSTAQVIANIEEGISENSICVILQHDIKSFSVDAVESVIIWGLERGYTFAALTPGSYGAHHTINN